MTEEELEIIRLKAQLEALRVLVRFLYIALGNSSHTAATTLLAKFQELRQEHGNIVLSDRPAVESDMVAAEYQEALNEFLSFIESGFKG